MVRQTHQTRPWKRMERISKMEAIILEEMQQKSTMDPDPTMWEKIIALSTSSTSPALSLWMLSVSQIHRKARGTIF